MTWFCPRDQYRSEIQNIAAENESGGPGGMDLLDRLDSSGNEEDKMMEQGITIEEHSLESDDEPQTEHLSPQTLLETPHEDVHYTYRAPDGTVSYRVLKVEEDVPQIISGTSFASASVPQILTGNINGQVYVIGNTNEVFVSQATGVSRTIAPRNTIIETTSTVTNIKKRDERRRMTHNEVERRRRDKINNWIAKLSKIIPEGTSTSEMKGNGQYDGQSKGGILAKACEYILELRESQQQLELCLKENKKLAESVSHLKGKSDALDRENQALREILSQNGIEIADLGS